MKSTIFILLFLFTYSSILIPQDKYRLKFNNIDISFDNKGSIGIHAGGYQGVYFDNEVILFLSGFALSGYRNDLLFTNGVMPGSLVNDYLPGKIKSDPLDLNNALYEVKTSDPAFGSSWQYWRKAVDLGAEFIDRDGDGIYNPIDKNNNYHLDENEDRPYIEGDINIWTVYNDGLKNDLRRYNMVPPIGIEIRQTVFAYDAPSLANTIFIRYRITYKGLSESDPMELDSILFSIWSDPDIGDASDDLQGTDSLLNGMFFYNDSSDLIYGENPPVLFQNFLQTPPVYIENVSFIDNNSNHVFDLNIDTPLDTAYNRKGTLGANYYYGAKDFGIRSSSASFSGDPEFNDANTPLEARNKMKGLTSNGYRVDPCTFGYGIFENEACSQVNPYLIFSGDPVTNKGWLNSHSTDVKTFTTTAPFQLKKNEPIDILVAYVAGRGTDPLNSITAARELSQASKTFFESNFKHIPVGIDDEPGQVVKEFQLHQNYPNPFNPGTTISFVIPGSSFVNLSVYDILGNKVAELVNEETAAGEHRVWFDGSKYSSGVYNYVLRSNGSTLTGKMILLK